MLRNSFASMGDEFAERLRMKLAEMKKSKKKQILEKAN